MILPCNTCAYWKAIRENEKSIVFINGVVSNANHPCHERQSKPCVGNIMMHRNCGEHNDDIITIKVTSNYESIPESSD